MPPNLRANLERVRERIARACREARRHPEEVRLLAVTKSASCEAAAELVRAGQRELGESRVEELERKGEALSALGLAPHWHLIGHLQRNKARRVVRWASAVHSVDTPQLVDALDRLASELHRTLDVFLEVKLVEGEERTGFTPEALAPAVAHAARLPHLRLRGLMTIAAPEPGALPGDVRTQSAARATFARLHALGESLPHSAFVDHKVELSMGMSSDLEAAVHAGSHWLRVGSALFDGADEAGA